MQMAMQGTSEREMKWSQGESYRRFACTQCGWSHPSPSKSETPETLDKVVLRYVETAFARHLCAPERTGLGRPAH
jgi:hypothetical protein